MYTPSQAKEINFLIRLISTFKLILKKTQKKQNTKKQIRASLYKFKQ